ncbi:hypothetical protein [Nocardia stercoris]|uniref:DUF4351 domain-containing protein n=1 Tax=Nocardia stercoris TaxID=2483361 RepID=A0A3M2L547_9NOCA|nr:hypothetical protein [Nocardia stercoris]RMI32711.1 hypothetical protein EBN03_12185 [Nocardia stercoris]
MPSIDHEVPLELLRSRPELAAKLAREHFGLAIPASMTWRLGPETVPALPCELRLDLAAVGETADRPERVILHEVQNSGKGEDLQRISLSWPLYLVYSRHRFRCPVVLLVFCPTELVAERVAATIETGHPGFDLRPLTYWPGAVKITEEPDRAKEWPEMVILALTTERAGPDWMTAEVIHAAFETLGHRQHDKRAIYYDYISRRISPELLKDLEQLMALSNETYKWESEFALRHQAIGEARGEARAVLQMGVRRILALRGIPIEETVSEKLTQCTDPAILEALLTRALDIDTADQLFN